MLGAFLHALGDSGQPGDPLVLELTTTGGDAEVGRRLAGDIHELRSLADRQTLFYGKAAVYSAGVTIMSGFPRADRWLAQGTMLLIHGRQLEKSVCLKGPLRAERVKVEALLSEIDAGLALQEHDFRRLIEGSDVTLEELLDRAQDGWYVPAEEALARGLIGGICRLDAG